MCLSLRQWMILKLWATGLSLLQSTGLCLDLCLVETEDTESRLTPRNPSVKTGLKQAHEGIFLKSTITRVSLESGS